MRTDGLYYERSEKEITWRRGITQLAEATFNPDITGKKDFKIFSNQEQTSGYQLAALYAKSDGVPGECVSAQHPDTTWGVYQIQNNKTLELVSWYHTSFNFTSEDLDENGNLSVAIGSFPIAVKGGGEVIPVCPSEENTENNIYRLNLNGLIVPGISYKIVTVKE